MEIRLHGRGGQGGVTCAKILAAVYAGLGKSVQAFGDYAGERSGAPVRAYTRVGDGPITNRNKVYEPDHLVVLDPTLLGDAVVAGLAPGGTLLLNSPEAPEAFAERFGRFRIATVDATAIARKHGIGTRSVVIVNTTIAGAFARVHELELDAVQAAYQQLGFEGNLPAAEEAYQAVQVREPVRGAEPGAEPPAVAPAMPRVLDLLEHLEGPPPPGKTGSWRSQKPVYVAPLAPCNAACPAGNDVVGFVQALARGDEPGARAILARSTPFPAVCGRVCPGFCMTGCNRRDREGAVQVRGLERYVADRVEPPAAPIAQAERPRRVAIVGSGPAGLSAAWLLALGGHRATIFEAETELGGVLVTGIPTFRLPREVLDQEIQRIVELGVETRLGERVDRERLGELAAEFDGVILATGLQWLRGLRLPGADLPGVEQGIRFLHRVRFEGGVALSGHVVVLGGGNTAMDCARTALRLGAERVTVAYRRTRAEMPAIAEEIDEAQAEGVSLLYQRAPIGFEGAERVERIALAEVEMGPPDDSGRRRPVLTDRTTELECSTVLLALGQGVDDEVLAEGWEVRQGRLYRDGRALCAFAAGDVGTNEGTVTHAIGDGKRAAGMLLRALGEPVEVFERPGGEPVGPSEIRADRFAAREPAEAAHAPPAERVHHFEEVNEGLADASEAQRCFACGYCTGCDTCLVYCPEGRIVRAAAGDYEVDYDYCKGCGICVVECPRAGMKMVAE